MQFKTFRITDTQGSAIKGASVSVYEKNTTNPISVFDENNAEITSLTTDDRGSVGFRAANGEYDITATRNGQIATIENVQFLAPQTPGNTIVFASRATFVVAAADPTELTLSDGGIVSAGGVQYKYQSGATAITDLPNFLPHGDVDIRHFGAVSDGATDDRAKVQEGIDYLTGLTGGGTLHFPEGTTMATDAGGALAISLKANVELKGRGRRSVIKLANSQDAHLIHLDPDTSGQAITDLMIDGNRANQSAGSSVHGIRLHGNSNLRLSRLFVTECRYYGIGVGYTAGTLQPISDCRFEDIEISNCGRTSDNQGDGFDCKRSERCLFQNIYIHDCEQRGLDVRGVQNVFDNIWAYNNGASGISFRALGDSAANPASVTEENYIKATNCYAFENGDVGFFCASNESPITGFKCEFDLVNCSAHDNAADGFTHRGTEMLVRYTNCTAKDNSDDGFASQNTDSDATCRAIFQSCRSWGNTSQGFHVTSGVGPHEFVACMASGNGANDQVTIEADNCSWLGGEIDAAGHVRGLYCTADGFTLNGANFLEGGDDNLRIDGDNFNVVSARFTQAANKTCFRIAAGADNGKVIGCDFNNVTLGTPLNNGSTTTQVIGCTGLLSNPLQTEFSNSDVNGLLANGATSGNAPSLEAQGTNTNIDLNLVPKGTGVVSYGTHTAIGAETVTGYITIKDSGGTSRKVAIVS